GVGKRLVGAWEDALQGRVLVLDGGHRVVDGLAEVVALLESKQICETRLPGQVEDAFRLIVSLADLAASRSFPRQLSLQLREAAVGELEEDQPEDRDGVLSSLEMRVGPKLVCGFPEAGGDVVDIELRWY